MSIRLPGFIDLHDHGAAGVDVNSASADDLVRVSEFLAAKGVAGWLPTLVPDHPDAYERAIEAVNQAQARPSDGAPRARILGVHYEGVFANSQMCGALRPQFFKSFTGREIDDLPVPEAGARMMTLAPEVGGGIDLIRELTRRGWVASIGHTHADAETLELAFEAGAATLRIFLTR
ncbi:MAG: N-acetylglucosamine-6-phosphate deacetylase [Acidobacteria bacterium OLB17]|nr:MAG: N-acetylglucosamine-6-phosphate deacetylase [Acidobacteria bacterium OLB17]